MLKYENKVGQYWQHTDTSMEQLIRHNPVQTGQSPLVQYS